MKRFRQALPEQDKTDDLDPGLIAKYYRAVGDKQVYQFDERYQALMTFQMTRIQQLYDEAWPGILMLL